MMRCYHSTDFSCALCESNPAAFGGDDWLLEHAPWLQEKPRIKVYVSMKTGKTVFGSPYGQASRH